jgi:hypothetical protein
MGKHRSVQKKRGEWKVKKKATGQYRMKTTGRGTRYRTGTV